MSNYYNDTCPNCRLPARLQDATDHENDRTETVVLCSNPTCVNFDAENLGPKRLTDFIQTAQDLDYHITAAGDKLQTLKKQADEIARMGMVKVETLIKKQEKSL